MSSVSDAIAAKDLSQLKSSISDSNLNELINGLTPFSQCISSSWKEGYMWLATQGCDPNVKKSTGSKSTAFHAVIWEKEYGFFFFFLYLQTHCSVERELWQCH